MSIATAILGLLGLLIFLFSIKKPKKNEPPGPLRFPFWGSLMTLLRHDRKAIFEPHRAMFNLSKKYGNILTVGLGAQEWVVLSGLQEIKEFSMNPDALSRPPMPVMNELYSFNRDYGYGVIFANGELWQEQRKFMAKNVKEMTVGYKPFSEHVIDEYNLFAQYIGKYCCQDTTVLEGKTFFDIATLNIIWRLATGNRFDYDDVSARETIAHMEAFTMEKYITIMTGVPSLKLFPPYSGIFAKVQNHMMTFKKQLLSYVDSEDDNSYAARFNEEARENSSGKFTEEQLIASLFDFFTGGSGTMSKTLSFAILYLLHYPEMEEKIRSETSAIDGEIGPGHMSLMPFTEAFIMEVQRLASVLPICPPRLVTSDITVCGRLLKKGVQVQMNLYALHRNEEHWGPDVLDFRPERFWDNSGCVKQDEWLQPFGYGKRKCLGETVAKTTLCLFLANIVKNFKLVKVDNVPLPDPEPLGGLTLMPRDFQFKMEAINASVSW